MGFYLRAISDNIKEAGTDEWLKIIDIKHVYDEYYEIEVNTLPGYNRYVCIDKELPVPNLEFAESRPNLEPVTHEEVLEGFYF